MDLISKSMGIFAEKSNEYCPYEENKNYKSRRNVKAPKSL